MSVPTNFASETMKQYRAFVWNEANTYLSDRVEMTLVREYMAIAATNKVTTMPGLYRSTGI